MCIIVQCQTVLLNHLWHSNFTVFLKGVHHQTIAADVVNALKADRKRYPFEYDNVRR